MPIYAYKCASCGLAKDVLQKMSDAPLVVCPACGEPTFHKQVTAAGFQLKGSGWYVTDFKDGSKPASDKKGAGGGAADAKSDGGNGAAKSDGTSDKAASSDGPKAAAAPEKPVAAKPADAPKPSSSGD